jgi:hypothetical protein
MGNGRRKVICGLLYLSMSFRMKALGGLLVIAGIGYVNHHKANEPPEVVQSAGGGPSFAGCDCTEDCSGHEAGYDWADEKGIDDEDVCDNLSTNSDSFKEGCKAYVNGDDRDDDRLEDDSPDPSGADSGTRPNTPSSDQDDDDDDNSNPD